MEQTKHATGRQFSCGAVVFMRDGKYVPLMGDARVAALRAAYNRAPLPDGLELAGQTGGGRFELIAWEQVAWDTCGDRVTGGAMRLRYFAANNAWAFTLGDQLVRMGESALFFLRRQAAVSAAAERDIAVAENGACVNVAKGSA